MTASPHQRVFLDLGCGARKQPGAIGVDIARIPGVDIVADVTRPLPFDDNSVDEVFTSHLVEHLEDLMGFMGEVHRICKPGAKVRFRFPNASTNFFTWKDPTHQRGVYLGTFDYYDPSTLEGITFGYYHPATFRVVDARLHFNINNELAPESAFRRVIGNILDALANRSRRAQYYCERFWGQYVGMEEAFITMRAVKKPEGVSDPLTLANEDEPRRII